jgi:hypothetical protein
MFGSVAILYLCAHSLQEAQDIFGDVTELLDMYESRKAAGASARCEPLLCCARLLSWT